MYLFWFCFQLTLQILERSDISIHIFSNEDTKILKNEAFANFSLIFLSQSLNKYKKNVSSFLAHLS